MSVTKVTSPMIESGTKGADIASAATVVIGTDGSYFDITGTTGISTQFTVDAGRRFTLQFDGAVTITDNAAITLSGAANFTTAAGDILSFVAVAANTVVQTGYSLVDGGSPVVAASGADTSLSNLASAGLQQVVNAWIQFDGTGTVAITDDYNVSSLTDNNTGDYTINFDSALPNANYAAVVSCSTAAGGESDNGGLSMCRRNTDGAQIAPTTGAIRFNMESQAHTARDVKYAFCVVIGD